MTKTEELQAADLAVLASYIDRARKAEKAISHLSRFEREADALQRIHDRLSAPRAYAEAVVKVASDMLMAWEFGEDGDNVFAALGAELKAALSVPEQAKEPGEGERLREALEDIANERGSCESCGKLADDQGFTSCDNHHSCRWSARDPVEVARAALAASPSSASGKEGK